MVDLRAAHSTDKARRAIAFTILFFATSLAVNGQSAPNRTTNYLKAEVRGTLRKAEKYFFIESLDRIHPRYKVSVILSRSEDGNTLLTRWLNENLGKEVIATGYIDNRRFSADPFTIYLRTGTSDSKVYLAPNESSVNLEKSSKLTVHR